MEENNGLSFELKFWVSTILGIVGIVLIGASFFVVPDHEAHRLFFDITRWIMIFAGSVSIIVSVVAFFLRDTPDIWM